MSPLISEVPFLGIYPKDSCDRLTIVTVLDVRKVLDECTSTLLAALFVIWKIWKQYKYLTMEFG